MAGVTPTAGGMFVRCGTLLWLFSLWALFSFSMIINPLRSPKWILPLLVVFQQTFSPCFLFRVQEVAVTVNEMQLPKGLGEQTEATFGTKTSLLSGY